MTELNTDYWPTSLFFEVSQWCIDTFSAEEHGITWELGSDFRLRLSDKNITIFYLNWS